VDPADSSIPVALARMEGKLDLLGASMKHLHTESLDHELRIRSIEARPTVTPKQLAGWLTLGLAVVSTAAPFVIFSLR
jgi:hypothetical protein